MNLEKQRQEQGQTGPNNAGGFQGNEPLKDGEKGDVGNQQQVDQEEGNMDNGTLGGSFDEPSTAPKQDA